jgi:putative RecB family exonuclease
MVAEAAWRSEQVISPTALKQFNTCPHRVRLRYIDKLEEPRQFSVHLSKGRITHDLLSLSAKRIARGQLEFGEAWFYAQAVRRLPPQEFPSVDARAGHARDIADWVTWALNQLDRTATILRIERGERRSVPGMSPASPLQMYCRPDLVVLRTLDDGEPLVEFIDYKTGREQDDHIVPVVMRYVFTEALKPYVANTRATRMRFTWYWLEARRITSQELDLAYSMEKLAEVRAMIERLLDEREWRAQPSYLCQWCPFRGAPCTAFADATNDAVVDE